MIIEEIGFGRPIVRSNSQYLDEISNPLTRIARAIELNNGKHLIVAIAEAHRWPRVVGFGGKDCCQGGQN